MVGFGSIADINAQVILVTSAALVSAAIDHLLGSRKDKPETD